MKILILIFLGNLAFATNGKLASQLVGKENEEEKRLCYPVEGSRQMICSHPVKGNDIEYARDLGQLIDAGLLHTNLPPEGFNAPQTFISTLCESCRKIPVKIETEKAQHKLSEQEVDNICQKNIPGDLMCGDLKAERPKRMKLNDAAIKSLQRLAEKFCTKERMDECNGTSTAKRPTKGRGRMQTAERPGARD